MKILLSAYACEPGRGSEPEVGLQTMLAGARRHQIWVLTRTNNVPKLEAFLSNLPERRNVTLVGVDGSPWAMGLKKRLGVVGLQLYYGKWQRLAAAKGRELDAVHDFDLVHHVTFASYWARVGVAAVGKPLIVGPVGGAVDPAIGLWPALGWRGVPREIIRILVRWIRSQAADSRRTVADAQLLIAQNRETASRLTEARNVVLFPNGISAVPDPVKSLPDSAAEVVMVGRLEPFKGAVLAVDVIALLPDLRLVIIGNGSEADRVRRRAARLGIEERVDFLGHLPREEVFARVARARVLLHPAIHDESPLTVAEALALGTPVVCLDRGGPPVLCEQFDGAIYRAVSDRGTRKAVVQRLADGIEQVLTQSASASNGSDGPRRPRLEFRDAILGFYEDQRRSEV